MEVFKGVVRQMQDVTIDGQKFRRHLVMGVVLSTEPPEGFAPKKKGTRGQATKAGDTLLAGTCDAQSLQQTAGLMQTLDAIPRGKAKRDPHGLSADQILTGLDEIIG